MADQSAILARITYKSYDVAGVHSLPLRSHGPSPWPGSASTAAAPLMQPHCGDLHAICWRTFCPEDHRAAQCTARAERFWIRGAGCLRREQVSELCVRKTHDKSGRRKVRIKRRRENPKTIVLCAPYIIQHEHLLICGLTLQAEPQLWQQRATAVAASRKRPPRVRAKARTTKNPASQVGT